MNHRLTLRQREFCRLYAAGTPAVQAAHAAGFAKSTCETNVARLLQSPLVQARILRLRNHTLIRRPDLEEMRDTACEIMRHHPDGKTRLAALRSLAMLDKMVVHPLDDQHFIGTLVMQATPSAASKTPEEQKAQNDTPPSELADGQEEQYPEETDTLPDNITPAFDVSMRPIKPIEPPKAPEVFTFQNLAPQVYEYHRNEQTGFLTRKTNAEIAAEYLALPDETGFDPVKGYPSFM